MPSLRKNQLFWSRRKEAITWAQALLSPSPVTTLGFRRALPQAAVCVFDNASTDGSAEKARQAGAQVVLEERRGKGFVVQRVFETVNADICVLVDGDDTSSCAKTRPF